MKRTEKIPYFVIFPILFCLTLIQSCTLQHDTNSIRTSSETITIPDSLHSTSVDILLLLDQSGSMNGTENTPATDPNNIRVKASQYLVNNISRRENTRMGIISFGRESQIESTLVPIENSDVRDKLSQTISAKNLGYTNFFEALQTSVNLFRKSQTFETGHRPVIIIFTDGSPADSRNLTKAAYFEEISTLVHRELEPERCELYIIGIDDSGNNWSATATFWEKITGKEHIFSINNMDKLQQFFNEIVQRVYGMQITQPDVVSPKGLEFIVPPYLDSIEFHVFPSQEGLELSIQKPDKNYVTVTDPSVTMESFRDYRLITLKNPTPGSWNYEIVQGQGEIVVYRNPIPVQAWLLEPNSTHPLGKQFRIKAVFQRDDGKEIKELADYPLRLVARLYPAGATQSQDVLLQKGTNNIYSSPKKFRANKVGKWKIELLVQGGHEYTYITDFLMTVEEKPYLALEQPDGAVLFQGDGVSVITQIMLGNQKLDVVEWFSDPAVNLVIGQIKDLPLGGDSAAVFLEPVDDGTSGLYEGFIPANLHQEGTPLLVLRLKGTTQTENQPVEDIITKQLIVTQSNWQWLMSLFRVLLILLVIISVLFLLWLFSLPKMDGWFQIEDHSSGVEIYSTSLNRKRFLWISRRSMLRKVKKMGEAGSVNKAVLPARIFVRAKRSRKKEESWETPLKITIWRNTFVLDRQLTLPPNENKTLKNILLKFS